MTQENKPHISAFSPVFLLDFRPTLPVSLLKCVTNSDTELARAGSLASWTQPLDMLGTA